MKTHFIAAPCPGGISVNGNPPFIEIPLGRATALCRSQEFHLDRHRHFAGSRNSAWTSNGGLPSEKIRSGDERHSAASQNSSWTAKTRTGGVRFCVSGGLRPAVVTEIQSAEDFGSPWKRKFAQQATSARRGSGNSVSGVPPEQVFAEIPLGKKNPTGWRQLLHQRSKTTRRRYNRTIA